MSNILQRLFKRKAVQQTQPLPFGMIWTGSGFTMIPYNVNAYIKDGYTGNSAVYTVVTGLMQKFAQVPYYVYKVKSGGKLKQYKHMTGIGYAPQALNLKAAAMDEVSDNNPISVFLGKPNAYQTESDFWQMAICFLKLTGMCPLYANKGATGTKLQSLHVLPSQWVSLKADNTLMQVEQVFFSPYGAFSNELPRDQVHLWRYTNPDFQTDASHLYGLSPLKAGLMDVKGSIEATKAMAKMYENGGARGIVAPKEPLSVEQTNQLRATIEAWLNGNDNRGKAGGMSAPVDFHNIGLDAVDMALIQGRNISDERIALIFGYPPELLKSDNKYDNSLTALKKLVTGSLYTDLVSKRDIINQFVLPHLGFDNREYFVDFDISILPEMQDDMEKVTQQAERSWWLTPNERRALTKYDTMQDPAMDTVYIPTGLTPIGDMVMDVEETEDYSNGSNNIEGKN